MFAYFIPIHENTLVNTTTAIGGLKGQDDKLISTTIEIYISMYHATIK